MMSVVPVPPPEGWSLREAAAALFPEEWASATLPTEDADARKNPGIMPPDNPLAGVPLERIGLIIAGAYPGANAARLELQTDELPIVERYRAFEAEIVKRLVEARKAAGLGKELLPQVFKKRMLRGDLIAYGIAPRARLSAAPTTIEPHLWAVARPHFGFDAPAVWHDHNGRPRMGAVPEVDSVSGLPGGAVFRGVRIRVAKVAYPAVDRSDLSSMRSGSIGVEAEAIAAMPAPAPDDSRRNKGGRPQRDDWPSFNKEAFRIIALDGGNLTLREFRKRMTEWAEANMTSPPDERTIRRYVDRNFDPSVFAPE
jgi:hypothetical protein